MLQGLADGVLDHIQGILLLAYIAVSEAVKFILILQDITDYLIIKIPSHERSFPLSFPVVFLHSIL